MEYAGRHAHSTVYPRPGTAQDRCLVMPGRSGRDQAERLRALRHALPVLYISGYVQDAAARATLGSEHSAFVAKPFTPELLADRVRELLATAEAGAA